jgi:hypothetical protein
MAVAAFRAARQILKRWIKLRSSAVDACAGAGLTHYFLLQLV